MRKLIPSLLVLAAFLAVLSCLPFRGKADDFSPTARYLYRSAADPASAREAQFYGNTASHTPKYYNGSAWKTLAFTDSNITGNAATATALAANGSNCSAGQAAAGVDASGAAEGCAPLAANTTSTANQFFTAYNSATGAFTKAQPAFSDLSGAATDAQVPNNITLTDFSNATHNHTNAAGGGQLTTAALSDYAEGTWTPALKFGGGSTGLTYGTQLGFYTKTGDTVFFTATIILTAKGSSTGAATITGLPVAASATNGQYQPVIVRCNGMTVTGTCRGLIYGFSATGTITIEAESGGTITGLTDAAFANTSSLLISGSYRTN